MCAKDEGKTQAPEGQDLPAQVPSSGKLHCQQSVTFRLPLLSPSLCEDQDTANGMWNSPPASTRGLRATRAGHFSAFKVERLNMTRRI